MSMVNKPTQEKQLSLQNSGSGREGSQKIEKLVLESWKCIAPFWPLKTLIAVNPLQGLEDLPIEEALYQSKAYFQQEDFPKEMEAINRETIKWLQAYFDEGQATFAMPLRDLGLYSAWKHLALYDKRLHKNHPSKIKRLKDFPGSAQKALLDCLGDLKIPEQEIGQFLRLLLTSLPGWASYIKYQTTWRNPSIHKRAPIAPIDYLAMRAIITYLLWPKAKELLQWHQKALLKARNQETALTQVESLEKSYRLSLVERLAKQPLCKTQTPAAQLVFCIDVRSEPFRRAIEAVGEYETFGFAGFFGIPIQIKNSLTEETYASCPVLLSPKHEVPESPYCQNISTQQALKGYQRLTFFQKIYQSMKYTFAAPFVLAEGLGVASGLWTGLNTLFPTFAYKLKKSLTNLICKSYFVVPSVDKIPLEDRYMYAENALKMMGLTHHFAPLVIFCGHGSSTQNNAYASALDCGACGGNQGSMNAQILASFLNQAEVRKYLAKQNIHIPETTLFVGAKHDTTTDEVTLYPPPISNNFVKLKEDLEKARQINCRNRLRKMAKRLPKTKEIPAILRRSQDWAQVRPEWGLARNAAFIIAPRALTQLIDLEGRCFLHSYDYTQDPNGKSLQTILTAPMVVAQWINAQYLFSTIHNVSFGGGSKVTHNISGKMGILQGNASDLMTGLPLQSVYTKDKEPYHEPQRLLTIVYAPRPTLDSLIQSEPILQKLFGNGWVQLVCLEPETRLIYYLQRDLTWKKGD